MKPREPAELRARLAEAEETLRAIRSGEVDAVMVAGKHGPQVFTLQGAEHAYRVLIESMNEGALTVAADKTILFVNQCFARMVKYPLEQMIGGSFRRFLSPQDRAKLRAHMKRADESGAKLQVLLHAGDGSRVPAQISIRPLADRDSKGKTIGMVVTDMTEARRNEEMLRALSHRLVQTQESERGRVARELHDHVTQLLCATLFRCQVLADTLPAHGGPSKGEAVKLREMVGEAAEEVERISRNLRPGVLDELGLVAVLRATSTEFADRTRVPVELTCARLTERLPPDTELTLYRVLQEALANVEQHARARHATVCLKLRSSFVELIIHDDGVGFDPERYLGREGKGGLGLINMRERAIHSGGTLEVRSTRRGGTQVEVHIPLPRPTKTRGRGKLARAC